MNEMRRNDVKAITNVCPQVPVLNKRKQRGGNIMLTLKKRNGMNDFNEMVQRKTNAELLKMIYGFDEWSPEMLSAVETELSKRNLLPNDITLRKQQLIESEEAQLIQGKRASPFGQIIGWLTVFGLFGILIGYHYAFSRVRSKYIDKEYFTYNESTRRNGTYLFYTSICLSAITILYKTITANGANV